MERRKCSSLFFFFFFLAWFILHCLKWARTRVIYNLSYWTNTLSNNILYTQVIFKSIKIRYKNSLLISYICSLYKYHHYYIKCVPRCTWVPLYLCSSFFKDILWDTVNLLLLYRKKWQVWFIHKSRTNHNFFILIKWSFSKVLPWI